MTTTTMTEKKEPESFEYGIDEREIVSRAADILKGNSEYRRLQAQYDKLNPRRDFAKMNLLQSRIRQMEGIEIDRLWELEMSRRKSVKGISDLLRKKDRQQYDHWQELLAGLSFLMDLVDFTVHDMNELLRINNIGIKMEKFKEIEDARALARRLTGDNLNHSKDWHAQMWYDESDRLWEYIKQRCATYRRKVDRFEARMEGRKK